MTIPGPSPDSIPLFRAETGSEWVVTLRFNVPKGTFKPKTLTSSLDLTPFSSLPTPVLCDALA